MNPRDLIRVARFLASGIPGENRGRPRQAELRRAVSAAYYALFHSLALGCANMLAGPASRRRLDSAWHQTYRALDHAHARNQCNDQSAMRGFSEHIRYFGRRFVLMQNQRQLADYSPSVTFSRERVMLLIDETDGAIDSFESATPSERREFALHVLLRRRRG